MLSAEKFYIAASTFISNVPLSNAEMFSDLSKHFDEMLRHWKIFIKTLQKLSLNIFLPVVTLEYKKHHILTGKQPIIHDIIPKITDNAFINIIKIKL